MGSGGWPQSTQVPGSPYLHPETGPQLAPNVSDFEAPGYLALDTRSVFHALLESESRHEAYRDYLRGALERGSRLVFSELLEVELAEACLGVAGREQHPTASALLTARHEYLNTVMGGWEALLDEATDYRLPIRETRSAQGWNTHSPWPWTSWAGTAFGWRMQSTRRRRRSCRPRC